VTQGELPKELRYFVDELDERTNISDSAWNLWRQKTNPDPDISDALDLFVAERSLAFDLQYLDGLKALLEAQPDRADLDVWLFLYDALELAYSERESFLEQPPYDAIPDFLNFPKVGKLFTAVSGVSLGFPLNNAGRLLAVGLSTGMTELALSTLEGLQVVTERLYGANTWSLYADESHGLSWFDAVTAYQDATS